MALVAVGSTDGTDAPFEVAIAVDGVGQVAGGVAARLTVPQGPLAVPAVP